MLGKRRSSSKAGYLEVLKFKITNTSSAGNDLCPGKAVTQSRQMTKIFFVWAAYGQQLKILIDGNLCNELIIKVGPQGFEPWTKGL